MRLLSAGRSLFACMIVMIGMPAASSFAQTAAPGDLGSVSIRVVPPTAEIFIDGERWVTPENSTGLVVQLPPGRHAIEIRARGFRVFATVVDVRRGETTPLNVSLSDGRPTPPSAENTPAAPNAPGPITQSVSDNGYAIAPDFRVTQLNHQTSGFAGVYGGRVFDRKLLIGAGGYWQTSDAGGVSDMVYGGAVVEWRVWSERTVGFNLHGLAGYGQARFERAFPVEPLARRGDSTTSSTPFTATRASSSASPNSRSWRGSRATSVSKPAWATG